MLGRVRSISTILKAAASNPSPWISQTPAASNPSPWISPFYQTSRLCTSTSSAPFSLPSSVPFKLFLDHGMDFQHWFVEMNKPEGDMSRQELIDFYIDTLAKVVGSKDEARMMIYSVSTKFYYAFGVKTSMEIAEKLKELPNVKMVEPDSYVDFTTKSYGAEPFVNGEAVPYDPKYHERWVTQQTAYSDEVDTTDYGDEIKPPWWSMPKIWYGRAYMWWISHKNKM